jgi:hypothetical protein
MLDDQRMHKIFLHMVQAQSMSGKNARTGGRNSLLSGYTVRGTQLNIRSGPGVLLVQSICGAQVMSLECLSFPLGAGQWFYQSG